ncbi:MAG: FAD-dependent oxidoreductase, partial [Pseudomonadota bacterium]
VAIIGSGMIGCELAEDLIEAGHQVTMISREALPLSNLLPETAALRLKESLQALGVTFLASCEISRVDTGQSLTFTDDTHLIFDQLVAATGLKTDNRLARQAGLAFDRGIAVDPVTLQTNEADIFALGDCISLNGDPCRFIEPIKYQAQAIAHGILGLNQSDYRHQAPVVRLKTRSLPIVIHGIPKEEGEWQTVSDNDQELVMEQRVGDDIVALLQVNLTNSSRAA